MKKTYQDRINLIERLERKYQRKVQLHSQTRRQKIKNTLRNMRGHRIDSLTSRLEAVDGILYKGSRAV